jgi:multiple sugar transport system ATP-binding protein
VLKEGGFLQQADTPRNLYDKPRNAFVAGFIGSPAMNLVTCDLDTNGAHLGNITVPLSDAARATASKQPKSFCVTISHCWCISEQS